MANKTNRIHALIQKNVTDIIQFEVKNKQIGFVSVTDCIVNSDNSLAKIYVSFLGMGSVKDRLEALNRCKGFIRSELAKRMDIYKIPELVFELDTTFDDAKKLEASLAKEESALESLKKK